MTWFAWRRFALLLSATLAKVSDIERLRAVAAEAKVAAFALAKGAQ